MTWPRKLPVLAAFALLALGSTGCIGFSSITANQTTSLGSVRLVVSACADGSPACTATTNSGSFWKWLHDGSNTDPWPGQVIFGVRLPDGATPPAALVASVPGTATKIPLARSASFESELQRLEPAPPGQRWWGWLSSEFVYGKDTKQALTLDFEVTLPHPADGSALPSPMPWRPVIGARMVHVPSGLTASRPVWCGDELGEGVNETPGSAAVTGICVDAPSPEAIGGHLDVPITDFGITGSGATAPAGSTVSLPFLARRTGIGDPTTTFALSVAGGPPGATLSLDRTSAPLSGDALNPLVVTVSVPEGTPAGAYPVTITGTAPGKPERKGTAVLTVPAKAAAVDPTPPVVEPVIVPTGDIIPPVIKKASFERKRKLLRATLSERAALTVVLKRGRRKVATLKRTLGIGAGKVRIARRLTRGTYRLVLTATDAAGNRSAKRTLTVRVR